MQLMKYSPLAVLVAGLMTSGNLMAGEWHTVTARATAADGYEVRASQYRIVTVSTDYLAALKGRAPPDSAPAGWQGGDLQLQPYDLLPADLAEYPDILAFKGYNEAAPGPGASISVPRDSTPCSAMKGRWCSSIPATGKAMPSITSRMPTAGWKKRRTR
jgi:hypothetical protein